MYKLTLNLWSEAVHNFTLENPAVYPLLNLPYTVNTIEAINSKKWVPITRLNKIDQYNVNYDLALRKDGLRYVFSE